MNMRKIIRLFDKGNVCVTGLIGTGKDMLFSNVVMRRKKKYISNMNYGGDHVPFSYSDTLALGGNTFRSFVEGKVLRYEFPYPDGTDIYISDAGVYFPSQEVSYLDKNYKGLPLFMSLSRHVGLCHVHTNVQNLERCYTKIREHSDIYIRCEWCKVFFGRLVIQSVLVYERADSCQLRVPPCPYRVPFFAPRESKELYRMKILEYTVAHGDVKRYILVYRNKSNYDTRYFKKILKEGISNE